VPSVVVFCIALGIALINKADKETLLKPVDILMGAVTSITDFVASLTPAGVFAIPSDGPTDQEVAGEGD
jgi:Na+/H+-dicarboxylate symporter